MAVSVEEAAEVTLELTSAFQRLVPQLSKSNPPPTAEQLAEVIASPGTTVFVAHDDDGLLVGTLTLIMYRIPTGVRAHIDDVVVDAEAVRGRGLLTGESLTRAALEKARSLGAKTVDLTSRPSRTYANSLYQRLGFEQRDTNVYRYKLET